METIANKKMEWIAETCVGGRREEGKIERGSIMDCEVDS